MDKRVKPAKIEDVLEEITQKPTGGVVVEVDEDGTVHKRMNIVDIYKIVVAENDIINLQRGLHQVEINKSELNKAIKKVDCSINNTKDENVLPILKLQKKELCKKMQSYEKSVEKIDNAILSFIASKSDEELKNIEFAFETAQTLLDEDLDVARHDKRRNTNTLVDYSIETSFAKLVFKDLRQRVIDYKPELFPELNIRNFAIKTYSNAIGDSPFNPDLYDDFEEEINFWA